MSQHVKGHWRNVEGKLVWVKEHAREGLAGHAVSGLFHEFEPKHEEPKEKPVAAPKEEPKIPAEPKAELPKTKGSAGLSAGTQLGEGFDAPETAEALKKEHFADVGKKVGGAAKDMAALKMKYWKQKLSITLDDLAAMEAEAPELAHQLLTKEQQLGSKQDFLQQMKSQGASPGAAYIAGRLWTAIEPPLDTPGARLAWAKGIERIQKAVTSWTTIDDAASGFGQLRDELTGAWISPEHLEAFKASEANIADLKAQAKGKSYYSPEQKALTEAQQTHYAKTKEYAKEGEGHPDNPQMGLKALGKGFVDTLSMFKKRRALLDGAMKVEHDIGQAFFQKKAKAEGEAAPKPKAGPKFKWERIVPDTIEKENSVGEGKVFAAKTLLQDFGFKGVEYGNWMDKEASQHHTQAAGEALLDLADVLGMSPQEVSLNGRLSLAFGARGKGKASAHYEPDKKVINLTKMGGGGSLAHEWGHSLDNILAMVSTGGTAHHMAFCSDSNGVAPGSQLPEEVQAALKEVHAAIHGGDFQPMTVKTVKSDAMKYKPTLSAKAKGILEEAGGNAQLGLEKAVEAYYGHLKEKFPEAYAKNYAKTAKVFAAATGQDIQIKVPLGKKTSHFVATGVVMGEYWHRKHELFARAWESFVTDKLKEKGRKNTYLVSGAGEEHGPVYAATVNALEPIGGKTSVYPLGEERKKINAAFGKLVESLKAHKMYAKAIVILDDLFPIK